LERLGKLQTSAFFLKCDPFVLDQRMNIFASLRKTGIVKKKIHFFWLLFKV